MKDFAIASGIIGLVAGAVLTVIARINTCSNCPYTSDRYNKNNKS